jgi:hypothetical protein
MDTATGPASTAVVSILFPSQTGTVKLTLRQIGEVSIKILALCQSGRCPPGKANLNFCAFASETGCEF